MGILFRPPDNVAREFPRFPVARKYGELQGRLLEAREYCGDRES